MTPSLRAAAAALLAGVMTLLMPACSRDVPTAPAERSAGAPQAGVKQKPANDDFDKAVEIKALPFTDSQNTSEATTTADEPADPDDENLCFVGSHTVWYKFTPSENMTINANTFGSDYDTGIAVFTGSTIDGLSFVLCNDDVVTGGFVQSNVNFEAVAGQTYYFMVGSFGESPGGNLVFRVGVSVELGLTINPNGTVKNGEVTISGTITCREPVSGQQTGFIQQRIGKRSTVTGGFFQFFECDGVTQWEAHMFADNGSFAAGQVQVYTDAYAFDRDFTTATASVRLKGQ